MAPNAMLSLLALTLVLTCTSTSVAQDDVARRPNILLVTSEDNSHHWIGCYGNAEARTPHIDGLAKEGIRYRFAYANAPVCAVARFTLITGRYACSMGTQNMRSRYPIPSQFRTYAALLREAGYYCVNRSKTDYNFKTDDKSHWDESSNKAHWKNCPDGKPFFAVFNSGISHESSLFASKTENYRTKKLIPEQPSRDPSSVQLPPYLPDTPEIRQDWVTYMDIVTAMDAEIGGWIKELDEAGLKDDTIVIYFSDHGGILPRAKRYIYDTGTRVPMIARVPETWSHLAPQQPGTTSERPVSFIDLPPTILSLAGVDIPTHMHGHAFLGEAAEAPEPFVFLYGQRFDSRMLRFVRAVTDGRYRYIRNFYPHRHRGILAGYPHGQVGWQSFFRLQQAGATTPPQSAFWQIPQPTEELYDTQGDPWETNNLADDPAHKEVLRRMRDATLTKMRDIRDTGLVPEAMYKRLSENGTVFEFVQDPSFPYDDVLALALAAGDGDSSSLTRMEAALRSDHPVMRYWGAVGCTVRGASAQPAAATLKSLLLDPEPVVRIAAAEALVAQGDEPSGLSALTKLLGETDDDMVALEALNTAAALGLTSRVPQDIYERACATGSYPGRMADDYPRP